MTLADWAVAAAVLVALGVIGVLAVDRNRIKRRLGRTAGVITGLTLDLDAMRARVQELQSYLNVPASWDVGAATPAALADPRTPDRWSPVPSPAPFAQPGLAARAETPRRTPAPMPHEAPHEAPHDGPHEATLRARDEASSTRQPSNDPRG